MPNKLHSKRYGQQTDRASCCCTIKKIRPCNCYGETEAGGDDISDSPNMSRGSGGSGAGIPPSRSRGRADGGVQEVGEGAIMILKLEMSPLTPWKKGRGGRRERHKRERVG
ncbi:hypothetical protein HID58_015084 [Brassica napus]|uniref:Uncharacterized protein n=1 Tax=Brassica napus TaxID=3708 RepID=A0ABQ8DJ26_BRANA|nr:hypothetical protein HID58_015084 [Brassica napus]